MTRWKISLVECVQHVHMLELRNWRSFQEELPSFVLLCSSTMSFHRMLTLFGAVLNWVLLTITITMIYSFWYPANSGFSRLDATLQKERNYCKWLFAFPSSMCIHVLPASKTSNDITWFTSLIFCMTMRWPKFISLSELGHVCRNIKLQFSLPTFDKVIV